MATVSVETVAHPAGGSALEELRTRLGIDAGTNSQGWCLLELDKDGRPCGVRSMGVRIFSDGRNPKDGTSLAVQRRVPRGMRRRRDRYLDRRHDLLQELTALGLMPGDEAERKGLSALDPYQLRAKAVNGPVTPYELGRALFHLNQRRGFKSNRKTDNPDDNSKIQPRIEGLKQRIAQMGAKTLGEYFWHRQRKGKPVRARPEVEDLYPDRALYESEFDTIREIQAPHQSLRPEQWDALRDLIFYQRPLKPVDPGWCLLEEGERRANRALPCAQEFRMVQEANNLRVLLPGEPARRLSQEERDKVLKELRTKKELKLEALLKLLKLPSGSRVNLLDENRKGLKGDETAARLSNKEIFGKDWLAMPSERRTAIVRTLLETEKPEDIECIAQADWALSEAAAKKLANTPMPEGYARLSEEAIAKLLPIMEDQGLNYAEAVAEVPEYGHHSDFRPDTALDRLPYYGEVLTRHCVGADPMKPKDDEVGRYGRIANPTVHIGLGQLRRVVNRLVEAQGTPEEIVIELARELKLNKQERDEERRKIRENETANERREEQIRAADGVPSPHLLRKLRLWEEQQYGSEKICPFTGVPISFAMTISEVTEIEHILPFSKTLDDSMANKVLSLREANRAKRDRTPYDAFGSDPKLAGRQYDYEKILMWTDALPKNKRWRFHKDAMEQFGKDRDFLDRQLNETKYLSRVARGYLAHLYNEKAENRLRVRAIPGRLTAMLRGKWGLNDLLLRGHNRLGGNQDQESDRAKKNRDDHRHHAIDAFVIAMTDQRLLQQVANLNSEAERNRLIEKIPPPWEGFTPDVLRPHLDRLVVSHKPDHGSFPWSHKANGKSQTSGSLHNDTAYGLIAPSKNENWTVVSRSALSSFSGEEKMDAGLRGVRDDVLRKALIAAWEEFKARKPEVKEKTIEDSDRKPKNIAAQFADHAAVQGIPLNGRTVKVRRVRLMEDLAVVPIKDRKTGKPYKAYKPDGNAFAEIYELPSGRWTANVVRRFDANQPDFDPAMVRPHPAAKKITRLHIDDIVALEDGGRRRIMRVVKLSGQTIVMADHNEAGALKARDADKNDPFKYFSKSAGALKALSFRKVGVDEIGRLHDPGPRKTKAA
ncbi:MAG TPA: type II CRISPR RNA-guided endonuclease Cas9 [Candidatus Acidoferrum sp.]|nr:type II CRISPR RNA-guided endonuclease Cas9 [Candidatus Acidoferrum sp.]